MLSSKGVETVKLDGTAVQYLLLRQFKDVEGYNITRKLRVDYPILYDVYGDMSGHTVLVPAHERPGDHGNLRDVLCVCVGEESARSACEAGIAVVKVGDDVAFQHLYNAMQAIFVRNERLDARLRAYVDSYAGFKPLVEACAEGLCYSCALVDTRYRVVCSATARDANPENDVSVALDMGELDSKTIDLFMASRVYRHLRSSRNVFALSGSDDLFMKNVFVGEKLVGALISRHAGDLLGARYARFVLGYLSPFVEEMYARLGSFGLSATSFERVGTALESYVRNEFAPDEEAVLRAALLEDGHDPDAPFVVARIERSFTHEGTEDSSYMVRRFESTFAHSHCFEHAGELYLLADLGGSGDTVMRDIPIVARDNLAKVGISRPFDRIELLESACAQASAALECGSASGHVGWCYRFAEYALPWAISHGVAGPPSAFASHPAVAVLARYDEERGTELLRTLSAFARNRYNATVAADELFVARSTLLNRLKRIEELTGIDLDSFEERVYLGMSLVAIANDLERDRRVGPLSHR